MLNHFLQLGCLALIAVIPFYFLDWVRSQKTSPTVREINAKSAKLCVANFVALYVSAFTGHEQGNPYATATFVVALLSTMLLFSFRSKTLQKIRNVQITSKDRLIQSVRSFAAFLGSIGLYYAIVFSLAPFVGILPAIAAGLIVVIGSAPLIVRVLFSCTPMHPSPLKEKIIGAFRNAGIRLGEVYLMDTDRFKMSNALVCGSKYGFGPARRSLFLTQNLFQTLEEDELMAVIGHEASHFQLHHIAKRGLASLLVFLLAVVFVNLPLGMIIVTIHSKPWISFLTMTDIAINLLFQFVFLFRLIRKHEFEADLNAVKLGSSPESLIRALEKITDANGATPDANDRREDWLTRIVMGHAHPSLEERCDALRLNRMPESARILPPAPVLVSYATIVLVIGAWFLNANRDSFRHPNREIASEKAK